MSIEDTFHPVTAADVPQMRELFKYYAGVNCDYVPANCLAWSGKHRTFVRFGKDLVSVRFSLDEIERLFLYPAGCGDLRGEVETLIAEEKRAGMREIRIMCDAEQAAALPAGFQRKQRRDLSDYVFDARAFAACEGSRYHRLRNFISASKRRYDARFEPLDGTNGEAMLRLARQSMLEKDDEQRSELEDELRAIEVMLENAAALELSGMVAYDGETPIAAIAASRPRSDVLDIHVRKQDPRYTGIAMRITHLFVSEWLKKTELEWFNCEEDLGLENLRRAKLSESPDHLTDKFLCTLEL